MEFKKTPKRRQRPAGHSAAAPLQPSPSLVTSASSTVRRMNDVNRSVRPVVKPIDEQPTAATPRPISSARRRSLAMPSPRSRRPKTPLVAIKQPATHPRLSSRRFTKKQLLVGSGAAVLLIGGVTTGLLLPHPTDSKTAAPTSAVGSLEYQAVLPTGKTIAQLGGWEQMNPPGGETVIAYSDTLDNVAISVTQQQLPQSFQHNADEQVAELAKKFNATTKLTADNGVLYVGTSTKGPQSVILTKNNLLITIKSQEKIADASWIRYVSSLR